GARGRGVGCGVGERGKKPKLAVILLGLAPGRVATPNGPPSQNPPAPRTAAGSKREVEPYFRRIVSFGRFSLHESSEFDGRAAAAARSAEEPCRVHSTSKPGHG